ncbi:MAG: arylsulfatase A-like enzyme [Planctomycetota bacterium]|jgi:arylsulfatase A-like enzyme
MDTVRADRMSLYGHGRNTTPFLNEWAQDALVFDNCLSTACSTVPSHASMFTGKLPSEHGTKFGHRWLDDEHQTIAEILNQSGYDTYLWAANPHISAAENFTQGFDVEEHPWDPQSRKRALEIVWNKVKDDRSTELAANIKSGNGSEWMIKAAGQLAEEGLGKWLDTRGQDKPYFAFINYMEAHRPMIPPRKYRKRMMSKEDVEKSKVVDRSWVPMWSYSFGLHEYTEDELAIMAATYDATIAELDDMIKSLLTSLEAAGRLENTVVIITADHGEHLGDHHMMDHQFSLYNALIHVPMIVHMPERIEAHRSSARVSNYDIFPTILELADIPPPANVDSNARSLLSPEANRTLLAELPATFTEPFQPVYRAHPEFDANDWSRQLRAYQSGNYKLIWSSRGAHELYDLSADPNENNNLIEEMPAVAARMLAELDEYVGALQSPPQSSEVRGGHSPRYLQMLKDLGYAGTDDDTDD